MSSMSDVSEKSPLKASSDLQNWLWFGVSWQNNSEYEAVNEARENWLVTNAAIKEQAARIAALEQQNAGLRAALRLKAENRKVHEENARLKFIETAARQVVSELPKYTFLGESTTEVKLATLQALWQALDMKPGDEAEPAPRAAE